ncbi:hypothetical protein AA105894_3007 [Asaia spathodeae NBRC 105894]|nr:hypothetical protein AA105894_3007 [Asaia spathodeae NBRC 105894]
MLLPLPLALSTEHRPTERIPASAAVGRREGIALRHPREMDMTGLLRMVMTDAVHRLAKGLMEDLPMAAVRRRPRQEKGRGNDEHG